MATKIIVGTEITPVIKHMTQPMIDEFERLDFLGAMGIASTHSSPQAAMSSFGIATPIASGHMSTTFISEALRRFFGPEVFNHSGTFKTKNIKPVVDGDTITVKGRVTEMKPEGKGTRVTVDFWCENQKGVKTTVGKGSALIPG